MPLLLIGPLIDSKFGHFPLKVWGPTYAIAANYCQCYTPDNCHILHASLTMAIYRDVIAIHSTYLGHIITRRILTMLINFRVSIWFLDVINLTLRWQRDCVWKVKIVANKVIMGGDEQKSCFLGGILYTHHIVTRTWLMTHQTPYTLGPPLRGYFICYLGSCNRIAW